MATHVLSRDVEAKAIDEFLASVAAGPCALIVEGEAGIGKTTVWLAALDRAQELGFRVLSTRAVPTESVLAYSSLADLLGGLGDCAFAGLPPPQRVAIDQVLLRVDADGPVTDQRAVAAAFLSVVERLAEDSPVLVAIDDLQWLDLPSAHVVSSAARRLPWSAGVLATVRTGPDAAPPRMSLELREPDRLHRLRVSPLSIGAMHAVLSERLGRSFARPTMVRIHEISGGNPFYAIELARVIDAQQPAAEVGLPPTLAELVRARVGGLANDVQEVLLAVACLAVPTVGRVARATGTDTDRVVELVEEAEAKGLIGVEGHRLRFTHPLLATGIYTDARPHQRRAMHRRLAEIVDQPELKARHLALAATSPEPVTLASLDAAAEMAWMRGAPAAAAELLDLAVGLGGDGPQRRIRSAAHHFNAGNIAAARSVIEETIKELPPGPIRAEALASLAAVRLLDGSFVEAAGLLERALGEAGDDIAPRVQMLVTLAFAQLNAGLLDAAAQTIEHAVTKAEGLGHPHLLSQALSMRVVLRFQRGGGLDEHNLCRALKLEDRDSETPVTLRPSMQNVLLLAWTGRLDEAHREIQEIRRRCIERGEESELMFVGVHGVLIDIWQGNFTDAALVAEDAMERALQLGGDLPLSVALMIRAVAAAYAGREQETRRDAADALAASQRCRSNLLAEWPITTIGFLELSLGNYEAALTELKPMLAVLNPPPKGTEIFVAAFVPDAAEAMIQLGRLDDAEPLIELLEANGRRLDRAWMLAVGGRCRAMLHAARGDFDAAGAAAQRAMVEHGRLPMPFELARTQLLMGQLQRRRKQREAASVTLREALATFERLGTPLWADRVRTELNRASGIRTRAELTASEQRVAELAATGITNREMAAALFISPKTVEANLSRIYRKLNIRSRAELGRHMGPPHG